MNRFFVPRGTISDEPFALPAAIEHQVRRVLRMRDDDLLVLLEGDGTAVTCRLDGGRCVVVFRDAVSSEPRHRLTVWQAMIKGDGLERVIQHGTELGVAAFRLMISERCVAREIGPRRLERLRSIAREAAEQSERGCLPAIVAPVTLADALKSAPAPASVLLYERHAGPRLGELPPAAALFIGPEGGFEPREVAAAAACGISIAGLGPRILRSETVALAAAAVILSRSGDFA